MRPPSGDEDVPLESPAPRQGDEKIRERALRSPNSKKKKPKRRLARKLKESTSVLPSDSVHRLRDEFEEEKENSKLVAHVWSGVMIREAFEPAGVETESPQLGEVDERALAKAPKPEGGEATLHRDRDADNEIAVGSSLTADNAPKGIPGVIDLSGSLLFTESMIVDAQALKERSTEEPQGAVDPFNNFFDGIDSTATEDITGLGDIPVPKKISLSEPTSSPKLVN